MEARDNDPIAEIKRLITQAIEKLDNSKCRNEELYRLNAALQRFVASPSAENLTVKQVEVDPKSVQRALSTLIPETGMSDRAKYICEKLGLRYVGEAVFYDDHLSFSIRKELVRIMPYNFAHWQSGSIPDIWLPPYATDWKVRALWDQPIESVIVQNCSQLLAVWHYQGMRYVGDLISPIHRIGKFFTFLRHYLRPNCGIWPGMLSIGWTPPPQWQLTTAAYFQEFHDLLSGRTETELADLNHYLAWQMPMPTDLT